MALGEYGVAREALDRLKAQVATKTTTLHSSLAEHLVQADFKLEGTYIVRVFAVFDAALRSYDRFHFHDQERETRASIMIDQIGALRRIALPVRAGVHRARQVRNFWAHELEEVPEPMKIERIRGFLHSFLNRFPDRWE